MILLLGCWRWCVALLVWVSAWCLSGAFDTGWNRVGLESGWTLNESPTAAALASLDWGWQSRVIDPAPTEQQRKVDSCGPAALRRAFRDCLRFSGDASENATPGDLAHGALQVDAVLATKGLGCTLGQIRRAATILGLRTRLLVTGELSEITPPAILHLRRGHFVVLEALAGNRVHFFDPAHGVVQAQTSRLTEQWSGAVLQFACASHEQTLPAVQP